MAMPKQNLRVPTGVNLDNFMAKLDAHSALLTSDEKEMKKREAVTMGNPISLSPPIATEEDWVNDMLTNAEAASTKWLKNTLAPRKDPIKAAMAANEKRKKKLAEAEAKDKWMKAMAKVSIAERQEAITAVGSDGYARGIKARETKIRRKIKELRPLVLAVKETVQAMPNVTDADREARVIANLRGMRKVGDKMRGIT